jgi:hypothetical protein
MKVHFLKHLAMALKIAHHPFGSDFLVLDDPGAKINEQRFRKRRWAKSMLGASCPRLA